MLVRVATGVLAIAAESMPTALKAASVGANTVSGPGAVSAAPTPAFVTVA